MQITVSEIQAMNSPYAQFLSGDLQAFANRPCPPERVVAGALVYVSEPSQLAAAIENAAGIIIATKSALPIGAELKNSQALFLTPSIPAAMALLNPRFAIKASRWEEGVSPQASVHPTAQIGPGTKVAPFAVIGEHVSIGENCRIGPNCVVEAYAKVGARTNLQALVFIGGECEIGKDCEIHPNTSIGADGFGFATDPKTGVNHKVPQLGKVILEDNVEVGSSSTIDRATLYETRIGAGTKMDAHTHIAHNCTVGKNGLYAAGFFTGGSSRIGDNFRAAGSVLVGDHVVVCDNVTVGGRSAVSKDVTEPGAYMGYPLQTWREGLRTIASLPSIVEIRRELRTIQEKLNK